MEILYRIVFDQSWRVGSGAGAGRFVDELVRRDGFDLPFVPGSTIRGLVANALRQLRDPLQLDVCDQSTAREEGRLGTLCGVTRVDTPPCPLCTLTGSQHQPARVTWGAARLCFTDAKEPLPGGLSREDLAKAAAHVPGLLARPRPRTAIERATGRADDQRLFSREEAEPGLELEGRIDLAGDLPPHHVALLVAALRWVREIGGSRRRGLGRCRLELVEVDLKPAFTDWREALESLKGTSKLTQSTEAAEGSPGSTPASEAPTLEPAVSPPPPLLRLTAVVAGEVAVGGRPEAGNLVRGLPFLPGSALRGALAARWRHDREGEAFGRCFLSGQLRFGFLYPSPSGHADVPLPHSLHTCKKRPEPRGHPLVDHLVEPDVEKCPHCGARLTPWGPRFGALEVPEKGQIPELHLSPHNRIDFDLQTTQEQALFAYQTLPEGTTLCGYLRADDPEAMAELLDGAGLAVGKPFRLRVGRRKGALGWLDCTLDAPSIEDSGVGLFPDATPIPIAGGSRRDLRIDLLTPALALDEQLRYRGALVPADFGLKRKDFDGSFIDTLVLSGWNSAHRLPKPDQLAVAAGSSFLLAAASPDELATLRAKALVGVGLRTVEGFGAFAVRAVTPSKVPA
jgi:CRISPR-associated protein Csx10